MPGAADVRVVELDYVREGFERTRERLAGAPRTGPAVGFVECNLDPARGSHVPLRSASLDAVLAALFLSYVAEPLAALREMHRVLRPGGRLVLSALRRDADMSKLYADGLEELRSGRARELLGADGERRVEDAARGYLHQAARLLDLEERGVFRFFEPRELTRLARRAGFRVVRTEATLGDPPQAFVLAATRS
jgi:SAM-dependent methyltransferase